MASAEYDEDFDSEYDSDENWDLDRNNPLNRIGQFLDKIGELINGRPLRRSYAVFRVC